MAVATADNAIAPVVDNAVASVVDNAVAPVVDNAVAPVVDNAVAPVVDNAVAPVVDNAVAPVVDNAVAPVVDNAIAPVVDNVVTPTADDVGEGAIDDLAEGTVDDVAEGTVDDAAEGTIGDVADATDDVVSDNLGEIDNATSRGLEGRDFFKEVEIINSKGSPVGEFDEIDLRRGIFFEDKTAKGLNMINPKTGKLAQTPEQFVNKQIIQKTRARINNLFGTASATRPTVGGTPSVPSIDELRGIKEFVFRLEGDTPELKQAVEMGLNTLRKEFPDFQFNAEFGVN
jgi:hypothetical protein